MIATAVRAYSWNRVLIESRDLVPRRYEVRNRLIGTLLTIPRDIHALMDVRKQVASLPSVVQSAYLRFKIANLCFLTLLVFLIAFAFFGYRLCA